MTSHVKREAAVLIAAALSLSACNQHQAADHYVFQKKEWFHPDGAIVFKVHPTIEALRKSAPVKPDTGSALMAYSRITAKGCEVHIVDPAVSYQPEYIGHEVVHCIYGRWHS